MLRSTISPAMDFTACGISRHEPRTMAQLQSKATFSLKQHTLTCIYRNRQRHCEPKSRYENRHNPSFPVIPQRQSAAQSVPCLDYAVLGLFQTALSAAPFQPILGLMANWFMTPRVAHPTKPRVGVGEYGVFSRHDRAFPGNFDVAENARQRGNWRAYPSAGGEEGFSKPISLEGCLTDER